MCEDSVEDRANLIWQRRSQTRALAAAMALANELKNCLEELGKVDGERRYRERKPAELTSYHSGRPIAGVDRDGLPNCQELYDGERWEPFRPIDFEELAYQVEAVRRGLFCATSALKKAGGLPLPHEGEEKDVLLRVARISGMSRHESARLASKGNEGAVEAARNRDLRRDNAMRPARAIAASLTASAHQLRTELGIDARDAPLLSVEQNAELRMILAIDEEHVVVEPEHVDMPPTRQKQGALAKAAEWLAQNLSEGPKSHDEIRASATLAGHSKRTLARAKKELGVEFVRIGKTTMWALPSNRSG